jgi:hypothetical protein
MRGLLSKNSGQMTRYYAVFRGISLFSGAGEGNRGRVVVK